MLNYIGKRLLQMLGVLFLLSILTFLLSYFSPSDPIEQMSAGKGAIVDEAVKEELRERYGLNGSLPERYMHWLSNAVHGDLGNSIRYNTPVWKEMKPRIKRTAMLAVTAFLFMLAIAVPLGILSALRSNRFLDYLIRFLSFLGSAFPGFWLGMLLLYWLGYRFRLVSVLGTGKPKDVILPAVTLAIPMAARYIRLIRTQMLEELGQEYVTAARALGVSSGRIVRRHLIPNCVGQLVITTCLQIPSAIFLESFLSFLGMGVSAPMASLGSLCSDALDVMQNYPYRMLCPAIILTILVLSLNLVGDGIRDALDPRLKK